MPARQLLKAKDKKFRLLFEEHPQPMWMFDPESRRFLDANEAAAALYGYSPAEFRHLSLIDIQSEDDVQRFLHESAKQAPNAWRHRTKSGRMIDVEVAVH